MITWQQWLMQASTRLYNVTKTPRRDSEILLEKVTGESRTRLLAFCCEKELNDVQLQELDALLLRRERGEPIAYLIGEREFWSLTLKVSTDTMIPRPETECLIEQSLGLLFSSRPKVLDLGTGNGAIALALASERPDWQITGIDRHIDAVLLARDNAYCLGLDNVLFLCGDWFKPLNRRVHYELIVSNPPYLNVKDWRVFSQQGEIHFEPKSALVAEENGLSDLSIICQGASAHLRQEGWLVLEHGWKQGEAVRTFLTISGFCHITTVRDYSGNERVSYGQWLS